PDLSIRGQCQAMVRTSSNGHHLAAETNDVTDWHWHTAVSGAPVAESTVGVVSPSPDLAVAPQCQTIRVTACRDRHHAAEIADWHRYVAARGTAITKLPRAVPPPRPDLPIAGQCETVETTTRNGDDPGEIADCHRHVATGGAAVTKLPI